VLFLLGIKWQCELAVKKSGHANTDGRVIKGNVGHSNLLDAVLVEE